MARTSLASGGVIGPWTLEHPLGNGANGQVWLAKDRNGARAAIKFLTKVKPNAYARFRDEVAVLKSVNGIEGILPVLGSDLPTDLNSRWPWYAMPVATPLLQHSKDMAPRGKVAAIADTAETLAQLHLKDIAHRDIKITNLLMYERRCHIGDFGLVSYPNKANVTATNEQLGPRWTMAPEVRRGGNKTDPKPADVYSLAKTLWVFLTGVEKSFDGQFDPDGDLSIKNCCGDLYVSLLEDLLRESTQHDPNRRPSMQVFAERLRDWLSVSGEYYEHNPLEWAELQRRLFPLRVPNRAVWEGIDDIAAVLTELGAAPDLNHLFFPTGGGLDLDRAIRSEREPDCIELITQGCTNIVMPIRLLFESFDGDHQWNYFRLETGGLKPTEGLDEDTATTELDEELTDIGGQTYASLWRWLENEYEGKPLPSGSRRVTRFFRGSFVIFQKTSHYNLDPKTYDARHDKMTSDKFRAYIAEQKDRFKNAPRPKPRRLRYS